MLRDRQIEESSASARPFQTRDYGLPFEVKEERILDALLWIKARRKGLYLSIVDPAENEKAAVECGAMSYGRTPKESPLDTIRYEIDHWRYACNQLFTLDLYDGLEKDLLIEGALAHYRNLTQFLSGQVKEDLLTISIAADWAERRLSPNECIALLTMQKLGCRLKSTWFDKISLYLSHMGKIRIEDTDWPLPAMYNELEPTLSEFLAMFPKNAAGAPDAVVATVAHRVTQGVFHTKALESPVKVIKAGDN